MDRTEHEGMNAQQKEDAAFSGLEIALPEYDVLRLMPRQTRYCVLIPVINEGERIQNQLRRMKSLSLDLDVAIVDGGSTDGSLDQTFLMEQGVRMLLIKRGPGKLSAQLRIGFFELLKEGYEGIITVDGNGKDGVEAIPRMAERLAEGYGFIQGSRYAAGGEAVHTPLDRALGVKLVHAPLLSLAAGRRYTDTTNGFRGFSRVLLLDPRVQTFRAVFDTYNLHFYLAVRAARLGYRVCELGVRRAYPPSGLVPSKISGWKGKVEILKQLWLASTGGYDPPSRP